MNLAIFIPAYSVGSEMSGIGLRAWELAQVLAPRIPVTIVAKQKSDFTANGVTLLAAEEKSLRRAIDTCSAGLFYDLPDTRTMLALHRAGKLVISENTVPIEHLEFSAIRHGRTPDAAYRDLVARFKLQLLLSDHFLICSHVARSIVVTGLSLVGRLSYLHYEQSPRLDPLFSWLPIGFNESSSLHAASASPTLPVVDFVWTGGIWDFYSPTTLVQAIARLDRSGIPLTVRFMYPPPPGQVLSEAHRVASSARQFGVQHLVQILDTPPPHQGRDSVVKSARAAVCIAKDGIENYTCVRFRLRDSFLYSLPVVIDKHGATGDLVQALDIGVVVNGEDVDSVAAGLATLRPSTARYRRCLRNLCAVRQEFLIDQYIEPLVNLIAAGRRAPDVNTPHHTQLVSELLSQCPELENTPSYPF